MVIQIGPAECLEPGRISMNTTWMKSDGNSISPGGNMQRAVRSKYDLITGKQAMHDIVMTSTAGIVSTIVFGTK